MGDRVLGFSVPVAEEGKPGYMIPAGTHESDIDPAVVEGILDIAWGPSPLEGDTSDRPDAGIVVGGEDDVPEKLEDCTVPQLREIAARGIDGEPIELGRVKRKEDMIEVLRAAFGEDGS